MYKKIINPNEELNYRDGAIDTRYLINEGNRAIGLFSAPEGMIVPAQISPNDTCFYVLDGKIEIKMEDKVFSLAVGEMLLIPKTNSYTINFLENSKALFIRF